MNINNPADQPLMLDTAQIDKVLDRLVPLIAAPEDQGVFRVALREMAEHSSSTDFAGFVRKLLPA